jgi:transposase InsO family protein
MRRKQHDQILLAQIQPIKADHPFWGYRRIWAYLNFRQNLHVNKKRVYRIMKEYNLLVHKNQRLRARRDNKAYRSKPQASRPNEFWGTDMTKVMVPSFGWLYLVVVLDWYTKKLVGYSISTRSKATDWLDALNTACDTQFPQGIMSKEQNLYLVSDNGSQPTSQKYMLACSVMEITQIFASYSNPKGNADTERLMRTIKEDFVWTHDFASPDEFSAHFKHWVEDYNTDYPHSSINYQTPCNFEKEQLMLTKI